MSVAQSYTCDIDNCGNIITDSELSLKVIHQNIRSISRNTPGFLTLLQRSQTNWDFIVLTECWLSCAHAIPQLDGYNNCKTNNNLTQNEGVVIYYKNSFTVCIEEPTISDCNCLMIKINDNTAMLAVYRPAGYKNLNDFLSSLDIFLKSISNIKNFILIGDFNVDIAETSSDPNSAYYLNLLASHGMLPAYTIPTHKKTCLDHIILKTRLPASCYVTETSITDHDAVILILDLCTAQNKSYTIIKRLNYERLDVEMLNLDFHKLYSMTDVDLAVQYFVNSINRIILSNTQIIKTANRKKITKPWITPGLLRCMRNRDKLHQKAKKNPNNQNLQVTYKRYRNFCNDLLKKIKNEYDKMELQTAATTDNKKLWNKIKDLTHTKKPKNEASQLINTLDPISSTNVINEFFVNIGKNIADRCCSGNMNPPPPLKPHPHSMVFLPTDLEEVGNIIHSLKPNCAVGYDNIPASVVKRYTQILIAPMVFICNLSINSGKFPDAWKIAEIRPIFKSGDGACINNYRPISILPALSKVLERIMKKRLVDYLEENLLLSPSQYGFRSGLSTSDAIHDLTKFVSGKLDVNKKVIVIFIDLAKAFDTVSVPILIRKLENIGIRDVQLKLFSDYLSNRFQRVKVDEWTSGDLPVVHGVPQGSIVSPPLFLTFINDLCELKLPNGKIISFADDTALMFEADTWPEVYSCAQAGFNIVLSWLANNKLALNVDKTKYMSFFIKKPTCSLNNFKITAHSSSCLLPHSTHCQCPHIQHTDSIKYLGVILDNTLSFHLHIDTLASRIRKLIYVFKNLRHVADSRIMKTVYFALCQSLISYCITVWGGANKTSMLRIERAQRAVLKVSNYLPFLFPTKELYERNEVLTVRQLFILNTILRKHSLLTYNPALFEGKRRKHAVCPSIRFHTAFARRHFDFLGNYLYNKINKSLSIYALPKQLCKKKLSAWLQKLDYDATEQLLNVPS